LWFPWYPPVIGIYRDPAFLRAEAFLDFQQQMTSLGVVSACAAEIEVGGYFFALKKAGSR
jgi:hypothetical protein